MKELLMNSGIIAATVVLLVAILKTPLKKFKDKAWYRPVLTLITIVLAGGLCVLDQLYILHEGLLTWGFLMLIAFTLTEVFLSYNVTYEGFIKKPLQNWITKIKTAKADESTKIAKQLAKFEKAVSKVVGIDTETLVGIVEKVANTPVATQDTESAGVSNSESAAIGQTEVAPTINTANN